MITIGSSQLLEGMSNASAQDLSVTASVPIRCIHVGIVNVGTSPLRELVGIAN